MAQNKMEKIDVGGNANGLMIKAAAFIAKYAKDGPKVRLRPYDFGVHKKSRGGECQQVLEGSNC